MCGLFVLHCNNMRKSIYDNENIIGHDIAKSEADP